MGTTADKLQKVLDTKVAIKDAIVSKGVEVLDSELFSSYPAKISQIGREPAIYHDNDIAFYDYDGTIVYSCSRAEAQEMTKLPTPPVHDRLTFDGWNWSLEEIQTETGRVDVGAMYYPTSGRLEYKVEITYPNQEVLMPVWGSNVNWGDGASEILNENKSHVYRETGEYWIETWGDYTIVGNTPFEVKYQTITECFFPYQFTGYDPYLLFQLYNLKYVVIPNRPTFINIHSFRNCNSLRYITIPKGCKQLGANIFQGCYLLRNISLPLTLSILGNNAFYSCIGLKQVVLPSSILKIEASTFFDCRNLQYVQFREALNYLANNVFNNCVALQYIKLPPIASLFQHLFYNCNGFVSIEVPIQVNRIDQLAFNSCNSLQSLILRPLVPPALANVNAIPDNCKIYVPAESIWSGEETPETPENYYNTATNWSTFKNRIYRNGETLPYWVADSIELWYDIKKQGATNEVLSSNPQLADFSGKNRPLQLYNFAFSKMSGVGGYGIDFSEWINVFATIVSPTKVIFTASSTNSGVGIRIKNVLSLPSFTIKVYGDSPNLSYNYYINDTLQKFTIIEEGVYTLPASTGNTSEKDISFNSLLNTDCTVELLPEYPDALVTDGVDDYGAVQQMTNGVKTIFMTCIPIGDNNGKNYFYSYKNEPGFYHNTLSISAGSSIAYYSQNAAGLTYINGVLNTTEKGNSLFDIKHIITNVCEYQNDAVKTGFFSQQSGVENFSKIAFYSAIGFNRVLTQEEIDWVIENMIDKTDIDMNLIPSE